MANLALEVGRTLQPEAILFWFLAPLKSGMLQPPHPMAPGTTHIDYYRGDIKGGSNG